MSDELGKWKAFDLNGKVHECSKEKNGNGKQEDLSLEVVLKKLESIGVTLDLTKLRNAINGEINKK